MFRQTNTLTTGTDAVEKRGVVAKMMKAWEAKATKRAANATGFTLMAVALAACNDSTADTSAADAALATLRTDLGVADDATTTEMMNAITALEATASSAATASAAAQTALANLRTDLGVAADATTTEMMAAITALETGSAQAQTALTALRTDLGVAADASTADMIAAITVLAIGSAQGQTALAALRTDLGVATDASLADMIVAITALETTASNAAAARDTAQTGLASLRTDLGLAADASTSDMIAAITGLETAATDAAAARDAATSSLAALRTDLGLAADATTADMISAITALETAAATAANDAVLALGITGVSTLADLAAAYDELANPTVTSFTLTTAVERTEGSNGNDTFFALNAGEFTTGDILVGGAGNDTLNATINDSDTVRPVMSGIQTINLTIVNAGGALTSTLNLDQSSDVATVNVRTHDNDVSGTPTPDTFVLSGTGTATTLTISDLLGSGDLNNNYTVNYTGVSGTSDAATVNVVASTADLTLGTITVGGIENLTVNATGGFDATYALSAGAATTLTLNAAADSTAADTGAGTVDLGAAAATTLNINAANDLTIVDDLAASAALRTVNIDSQVAGKTVTLTSLTPTVTATSDTFTVNASGAGRVVFTAENTAFGTQTATNSDAIVVDASQNTGGVTADLSAVTGSGEPETLTVTGGSGNDTVIITAGALDDHDTIALGGGTADTLQVTATYATHASTDAFYAASTAATTDDPVISGVEIARVVLRNEDTNDSTVDLASADFASQITLIGAGSGGLIGDALSTVTIGAGQTVNLGDAASSFNDGTDGIAIALADATGTADVLTVTTNMLNSTLTGTLTKLTVADIETLNVDLASAHVDNTTINATIVAADTSAVNLTGSKITIAAVTAKDGATIDASAVTGVTTLTVDNAAKDYTIKGSATAQTTFVMGTQLDDGDNVQGGSATTDKLTATVNGLTATTGALNISGVDEIVLKSVTAVSTIDAGGISGAGTIRVTGNGTDSGDGSVAVTLTNLASGVNLGLGSGIEGTDDSFKSSVNVALADASGASDALNVFLGARSANADITATLVGTGIETLTIVDSANADQDATLDVSGFAAGTVNLSHGKAGELIDLTVGATVVLNATTTTVNAAEFAGVLTAKAAVNTSTSFTTKVAAGTLTGQNGNDTFTVGNSSSFVDASIGTIVGGSGTDVLTAFAGGSSFDLDAVTGVETVNVIFDDVAGFNIGAGGGSDGIITASTVTFSGGKSGETYGVGSTGVLTDLSGGKFIDASQLLGSVSLVFGDDALVVTSVALDPITIIGGQGSLDVVEIVMTNSNTGVFTMSGVETLVAGNTGGSSTINLTNVTGLSNITLHNAGGTGTNFVLSAMSASTSVTLGDAGDEFLTQTVDINLADASGSSDAVTVNLFDTNDGASVATVDVAGVETLTLALRNAAESHTVAVVNDVAGSSVVVTGSHASANLTLNAVGAGTTTVNAAGLAGALTIAASARGSDAMTITGGTGADTVAMENANDVLTFTAGTADDDLHVSFSGTGGAIIVDLSSTTDQVTLFNGVANAAVQVGFEDVNLSGYVQTNSIGADITGSSAANEIVGTSNADTIRGGAGGDTITGGGGNDTIVLGSGADIVIFEANAGANGVDTITGFTSTSDHIDLNAATTTTTYVATAGSSQNVFTGTSSQAITIADDLLYVVTVSTAGAADTVAGAAAAISAAAAWTNGTNGDVAYFVVVDDNSSAVFSMTEAGGTEVESTELTFMGTIDAILVTGDILIA